MEIRERALAALCLDDPATKAAAVATLWAEHDNLPLDTRAELTPSAPLPGRPGRPRLIPAIEVPQRSPFTPVGLAGLLHAIAHIEFNAINLALDAVWRYPGMPEAYYRDWLRVAYEESLHYGLLAEHLQSLGHAYGDFDAHDGLWNMCVRTQDDITARMALVPRTLEARGLDATPLIQAKLRRVDTPPARRAVDILDVILRDEIGHVAVGNRWYAWLCERQGLEPVAHYRVLVRRHEAPRLRPPFNETARRAAGFSSEELEELQGVTNDNRQ